MAKFINKKEQVFDFQLTTYGRHLLSAGTFKPVYYAFYDDDILYDTKYAGYIEQQNESQVRILENTPTTKAQYVRHGIESSVAKSISVIRSSSFTNAIDSEFIQQTSEKIYSTSLPIGTSEYNSSYVRVRFSPGSLPSQRMAV